MWNRKNDKEVRWLIKLNPEKARRRDRTKHCRFYKDHGHTTEECRQLKDKIERLIKDGTLKNFARKDREENRLEPEVRIPVNSAENEPIGVIHLIAGGLSGNKGKNKHILKMSFP